MPFAVALLCHPGRRLRGCSSSRWPRSLYACASRGFVPAFTAASAALLTTARRSCMCRPSAAVARLARSRRRAAARGVPLADVRRRRSCSGSRRHRGLVAAARRRARRVWHARGAAARRSRSLHCCSPRVCADCGCARCLPQRAWRAADGAHRWKRHSDRPTGTIERNHTAGESRWRDARRSRSARRCSWAARWPCRRRPRPRRC